MKAEQLKGKTKYTASVFKDVEFNHGVNFVSKELYDNIGKDDKVYGMELFEKEDIKSAVEWLKSKLNETEMLTDENGSYIPNSLDLPTVLGIIDQAFPDLQDSEKGGK